MGTIHGITTNFNVGDILFSESNNHYLVVLFVDFDSILDDVNSHAIREIDYICICYDLDEALNLNVFDYNMLRNELMYHIMELNDYLKDYNPHLPLIPLKQRNFYAVLNDL